MAKDKIRSAKKARPRDVRVSKNFLTRLLYSNFKYYFGLIILAIIVVYLGFAATLMRVIVTADNGFNLVRDAKYTSGAIPKGTPVLLDMKNADVGDGPLNNIKNSFSVHFNTAKVVVASTNHGQIIQDKENQTITVGSDLIQGELENDLRGIETYLNQEFVAYCVSGDCNPGNYFIASQKQVLGELLDKKDFPATKKDAPRFDNEGDEIIPYDEDETGDE